jgi:hypothetical protein
MASNSGGGQGGSGIVIISYTGAQQFGGGVVTSVGGNTIHTFTTSGVLSPISSLSASYLIVAGGGGGAGTQGGGGAGGGLLSGSGLTIDTNSTYLVTVGAGGAGGATGVNNGVQGGNSVFGLVSTSAVGGGYGGAASTVGGSGGSGGGGGGGLFAGGSGTSGQGNAGGTGNTDGATYGAGGGGGGAGAVGTGATTTNSSGGAGGVGVSSSISGTATYYAGGGGGGANGDVSTPLPNGTGGVGGNGGGGHGATGLGYLTTNNAPSGVSGTTGTINLGGGGGGGGSNGLGSAFYGFAGGSGIVIISYAGSTQQMAGGTVTIVGGNVIHTFTSSGYLTPLTLLNNSLRFRSSASAYLNRTPTVASNRKTWTWSGWVKLSAFTAARRLFSARIAYTGDQTFIQAASDNTLLIGGNSGAYELRTTAVYRDPAAWYHIVLAFDTTQATSSNRIKLYVNGVQVTALQTATYPSQNLDTFVNATNPHSLGAESGTPSEFFDGYMANVQFIDGQQLTANSFGTFNSYGVWQPINYGGSYGTNGFYLPFSQGSSTYAGSFNGSSQYLSLASNAAFGYGTGDFTIEFWLYMNDVTTNQTPYDQRNGGGTSNVPTLYLGSGTMKYLVDGANQITSGTLTTNNWFHVALARSGTSTKLFINGTQAGSTYSDSHNYIASPIRIGNSNDGIATAWVNGFISNVRVVKGTALYLGNFVPPTSPLTAVSNTQLLTLQSATIVDNSTNAFTITNTGSVTTSANTVVFANPTSLCVDQSPQGNNWTPNNISNTSGSTYDSMTDVPTLTSATVANYAVFNPLNIDPAASGVPTLTNGNLTATGGNQVLGFSTMGITTGKFYWEYTILNVPATPTMHLGVTVSPFSGTYLRAYRYDTGDYFNGTAWVAYGATFTTGDVIGVALDMTSQTIEFFKNNTSQGQKTSIGLAGLTMFPYIYINSSPGSVALNFGQQPFKYTPPTNFVALNTYNL